MYQVELVWNREFGFVPYGRPFPTIDEAARYAEAMQRSGDGARVKKTRVVDSEGKVVWAYGKRVEATSMDKVKAAAQRLLDFYKHGSKGPSYYIPVPELPGMFFTKDADTKTVCEFIVTLQLPKK